MAVHGNLWDLTSDTVDEYLIAARACLAYKKPDGGCLGCPGALLLLCTVNAIGTFLLGDVVDIDGKPQKITGGEPFRVLNHPLFGQGLSHAEIKRVEKSYRNRLAHNARLDPDSWLIPGPSPTVFRFDGDRVGIAVHALFALVESAWERFDRKRIQLSMEGRRPGTP